MSITQSHTFILRGLLFLIIAYSFLVPLENFIEVVWGIKTVFRPHRVLALLTGFLIFSVVPVRQLRYDRNDLRLLWFYLLGLIPTAIAWMYDRLEWSYFIQTSIQWLIIVWIFLQAKTLYWNERSVMKLLYAFVTASMINGLFMIYWFLNKDISRQNGFMDNPNFAAFTLNIAFIYFIQHGSFVQHQNVLSRIFVSLIGIALSLGAILVSGSRGALIAVILTLLVFLFYRFSLKRLAIFGILLLCTSVVLQVTGMQAKYTEAIPLLSRLDRLSGRNESRLVLWEQGWLAFQDSYCMGLGIEQFKNPVNYSQYMQHADNPMVAKQQGLVLHNDFLAILFEYGVLSFIVYLIFFITLGRQILKITDFHQRRFWLLVYLNVLTFMFFSTTFQSHAVWFVILLLSMITGSMTQEKRLNTTLD